MLIAIAVLLFLILNVLTGGKLLESLYSTLALLLLAWLVIANWEFFLGTFALIAIGLVIWILPDELRRIKSKSKPESTKKYSPNYEERERMISEGNEVEDRIYQHASGFYVVRGKQGGSKAFRTIEGARNARKP